ncbi:DUF2341 domain-containing protein, partial [Candidatus Pacearchaeota archaeon]|nr:DUF2341 domain-containing protein [Candidatus Pacearchaeota archaeon]
FTSEDWFDDVSGEVVNMSYMFYRAYVFNQLLNSWNTSSVTNMSYMFFDADAFNQPLNNWNTSSVTDMKYMFYSVDAFNQSLNNWNTSSVTNMKYMFYNADAFNSNISDWDTSKVTDMSGMFYYNSVFNQSLNNWDISSVTTMFRMFYYADAFNGNISNWNTSSVTTMSQMFYNANAFNQPLNNWNTSSVTDMSYMFSNADVFNQDIGNWNVSAVTDMTEMFNGVTLSTANYDSLLNGWASLTPNLQGSVPFHGGSSMYSISANASRNGTLIGVHSWSITDGGFVDIVSPTYSLNQTNNSEAGQSTLFSIYWNDGIALHPTGQYIFSTNNTGTWANESAVNFSATPSWANVTKTLNSMGGVSVGYRWYADDNAGNVNNTGVFVLTTVDTIYPKISFVSPTLANDTSTTNTSIEMNVSINESDLNEVKWNWNGTNYTLFNDSLVLMMNFDNVSALGENDSYVVDISGNGNDGSVSGAVFNSSGKYGGAFDFDGNVSYIDCGNDSSLDITDVITIEAWVNPLGDYGSVVSKSDWKYKKSITLSPVTPGADYQVKVELTTSNFNYSKAKANGDDLRFYQADGTELSYEIETWNTSGTSTIWARVHTSGTDTIYIYYGNSEASAKPSRIVYESYSANTFYGDGTAGTECSSPASTNGDGWSCNYCSCAGGSSWNGMYMMRASSGNAQLHFNTSYPNEDHLLCMKMIESDRWSGYNVYNGIEVEYDEVNYSGTWVSTAWNNVALSHDYGAYADVSEASVSYNFTGTSVGLIYLANTNSGIVNFTIDGEDYGTLDTYRDPYMYQSFYQIAKDLSPTEHTLVITNTGTKNSSSSSTRFYFDSLTYIASGEVWHSDNKYNARWSGDWDGDAQNYFSDICIVIPKRAIPSENLDLNFGESGRITNDDWISGIKLVAGGAYEIATFDREMIQDHDYAVKYYWHDDGWSWYTSNPWNGRMMTGPAGVGATRTLTAHTEYPEDPHKFIMDALDDRNSCIYIQIGNWTSPTNCTPQDGGYHDHIAPIYIPAGTITSKDFTITVTAQSVSLYATQWLLSRAVSSEPIATVGNETAAGISKGGAYGIGVNTTTAFASINNQTISGVMSPNWNHIVQVYDGSNQRLYVNGNLSTSSALTGTISANTNSILIGDLFNGSIDEVRIYNRSLSADEVYQQYVSNLNKYDTDKWLLYVNQSKNATDVLDGGTYTYFASAKDTSGNENLTEVRTVSVDSYPTYSLNQTNNTFLGQSTLFSIYWDDDVALHPKGQYIFSTNNTGVWANESAVNFTATPSWANVTKVLNSTKGISIGYRWYASDNNGNWSDTEIFSLVTTNTNIIVNLISPLDNWEVNSLSLFECNASSDISLLNISLYHNYSGTWSLNDTTNLSSNNASVKFNVSGLNTEKTFVWNCYACDVEYCYFADANRTLTFDLTSPTINFTSPTPGNDSVQTETSVYVNVSIYDVFNNYSAFIDWNRSLVGWWRLEQGNGTSFEDSSSWGNNGSCSGSTCPNWTIGYRGKAYDFDGVDDSIDCGNDSSLDVTDEITIEAWVKPEENNFNSLGGTITTDGTHIIHTFTSNGVFEWEGDTVDVEVLVVGGGGSGGTQGSASTGTGAGGGGAGGLIYNDSYSVTSGNISITIGAGGVAPSTTSNGRNSGGSTTFGAITASGGGGGGYKTVGGIFVAGQNGGSGGGAGQNKAGGTGVSGQGYRGGNGWGEPIGGAGGGGADEVGVSVPGGWYGGAGGSGKDYSNIFGTGVGDSGWFAGGGGGGSYDSATHGGYGASGGGGNGGRNSNGISGIAGTGGGGGGSGDRNHKGGNGGSGIVIVRYPIPSIVSKGHNTYGLGMNSSSIRGFINNQTISTSVILGTYQHVAFSYDGSNQKLYTNGILQVEQALTGVINTSVSDLTIGGNYFSGIIDEVQIFSRALSSEEINASYQAGVYRLQNNFTNLSLGDYIYQAHVVDQAGNLNSTEVRSVIVNSPPTYSLNQTNNTIVGQSTLFSIYWDDNLALHPKGQYIFSTNNTGVWANESAVNFSATPSWANVSKILNSTREISIGYRWYADDNVGNWNVTEVFSLVTINDAPVINFTPPTPANNTSTTNTSIEINVSIIEVDLDEVKYNWNGTNYSLMNDSLVLMMNFDNVSALGENDTHVVDVSGNGNNGTSNAVWNSSGKFGAGAFSFDATHDHINVGSDSSLDLGTEFSVAAWVKSDSLINNGGIVGKNSGRASPYSWMFVVDNDGTIGAYDGGEWLASSNAGIVAGNWYYVTWVVSGGNVYYYVDGTSYGFDASFSNNDDSDDNVYIGSWYSINNLYDFDGLIDEVRIWNRSLSADEVSQMYMSNLNKYDTDKWLLYVNQSKNATDVLDTGTYTYFASAKDDGGNENVTEVRSVSVDGTAPTYSLNQTNNSEAGQSTMFSIYWDDNVALHPTGQYIFSTNNTGTWANESAVNFSATPSWANVSKILNSTVGVSVGYRWYADDNMGNVNNTGIFVLTTTDGVFPEIGFVSPTLANDTSTTNTSIEMNVSINETNLDEVKWNWNGTNYTIFNDSLILMMNFDNVSALGENDTHVVDVSGEGNNGTWVGGQDVDSGWTDSGKYDGGIMFDGSGDYVLTLEKPSYDEVTFVAWIKTSQTPPNLQSGIISNYNVVDGNHLGFRLYDNGKLRFFIDDNVNAYWGEEHPTIINDGIWHFVCGVFKKQDYLKIYIDDDTPYTQSSITTGTITSNTAFRIGQDTSGSGPHDFSGNIDEFRIYNRSLSADEISQLYMSNLNKYDTDKWLLYVNQSKNATDVLDAGTYTYFASAKDSAGNENLTEVRTVNVDGTSPVVTLVAPANASTVTSLTQYFSANFTDTQLKNATPYVWNSTGSLINSSETQTVTGVSNSSNVSIVLPSDATYIWNYYVCDNLDNCGWASANWTVSVDASYPEIGFVSPTLANDTSTTNTSIEMNV